MVNLNFESGLFYLAFIWEGTSQSTGCTVPVIVVAYLTGHKWKLSLESVQNGSGTTTTKHTITQQPIHCEKRILLGAGEWSGQDVKLPIHLHTVLKNIYGHTTPQWYFLTGYTVTNLHFTLSYKFVIHNTYIYYVTYIHTHSHYVTYIYLAYTSSISDSIVTTTSLTLRCVIPVVCWKTNGELISVRKHNYNCMLDGGIY